MTNLSIGDWILVSLMILYGIGFITIIGFNKK